MATFKRFRRVGLALVVALAGATAFASTTYGGGRFRAHVAERIDAALSAAQASPEQRAAIDVARDQVFATLTDQRSERKAELDRFAALFTADQIDTAQLNSLRDARAAEAQKTAEAFDNALLKAHDTLRPEQRSQVVAYLRTHRPGAQAQEGRREQMKQRFAARLDAALTAVNATPGQRSAIQTSVGRVTSAIQELRSESKGTVGTALRLFEQDHIDPAQLETLRAERAANRKKVGDAMVQSISEIHDTLTAPQRQALVEYVRTHHLRPFQGGVKQGG